MGRKAREAAEAARASLQARYARDLGPSTPPCANPKCNPGGAPQPSKGTVRIQRGTVPEDVPVCSPLRCAFDVAGDLWATATWAPHPPGRYREAT